MARIVKHATARRGLALIEMAIVLPLLLFLTFGMLEYGLVLLRTQEINRAARLGAECASRYLCTDSEAESVIQTAMSNAGFTDAGAYTASCTNTPFNVSQGGAKTLVTCSVDLPYTQQGFTLLPGMELVLPSNLRGTATYLKSPGPIN